jgi:hypothetical protein
VVIRLSKYLSGHLDALEAADQWLSANASPESPHEE